jgi:hypothetical protein
MLFSFQTKNCARRHKGTVYVRKIFDLLFLDTLTNPIHSLLMGEQGKMKAFQRISQIEKSGSQLTLIPVPSMAEQPWICHVRSFKWTSFKHSAISEDLRALEMSCLLAKINKGTPLSLSSSNRVISSSPVSSRRLRSLLSIT